MPVHMSLLMTQPNVRVTMFIDTQKANVRERLKLSEEVISMSLLIHDYQMFVLMLSISIGQYGFLTKQFYMAGRTLPTAPISPSPPPSKPSEAASPLQSTIHASTETPHDHATLLPLNIGMYASHLFLASYHSMFSYQSVIYMCNSNALERGYHTVYSSSSFVITKSSLYFIITINGIISIQIRGNDGKSTTIGC
jgi:hypothetical protein